MSDCRCLAMTLSVPVNRIIVSSILSIFECWLNELQQAQPVKKATLDRSIWVDFAPSILTEQVRPEAVCQ